MKVSQIAAEIGGRVIGDGGQEVRRVASLAAAQATDLSFVEDAKFADDGRRSAAGALITAEASVEALQRRTLIVVRNPRLGFAKAGALLAGEGKACTGVHKSAVLDSSARLGEGVSIGAQAFIGPRVAIGRNAVIGPGCVLLGDIEIGEDCELVARVTVYPHTKIGDRVTVHAGAVLGSDGFGFVPDEQGRYHKFPQIGRLEVGNDVEIGANATVDRGALDATILSDGVKLDNLVHIGHNVRLGENVVSAAQTGISGSSVIEKNVLIGGQVGIADHVTVEEGAILGAQAGIPSNKVIRGKGVVFWGTPARPIREYLKELAVLARLVKRDAKP
ncbi:MAG: UDP-3-O-(3-hydroxymyristoyl)glucosamine N-acyltransferase [Terriglobia bacterium]|jgi:UDP-3-O-[3-hydroxymyristoyl] glucosamine N-acyltransferase|nr:UDP-3-O-(3-hydroxymyristoyl)glucosamine N-acyltransferase [Terriglobia bacterium]